MLIKDPPKGLYAEKCIWMEAKDLEGFNAHFSFRFINKPTANFHPLEGAIVHPYDELMVFETAGNTRNILTLDAEISVEMGAEREEHIFTEPTVVLIPAGTPHGAFKSGKSVSLSSTIQSDWRRPTKAPRPRWRRPLPRATKYSKYVKKMITAVEKKAVGSGMGYESVIGQDGIMRPAKFGVGPATAMRLYGFMAGPRGIQDQLHLGPLQPMRQMAPRRRIPLPSGSGNPLLYRAGPG